MMKTDLTKYDELIKAALNAKLTTEDNTYSHVINSFTDDNLCKNKKYKTRNTIIN